MSTSPFARRNVPIPKTSVDSIDIYAHTNTAAYKNTLWLGSWQYPQILDYSEKLAGDKHTPLSTGQLC